MKLAMWILEMCEWTVQMCFFLVWLLVRLTSCYKCFISIYKCNDIYGRREYNGFVRTLIVRAKHTSHAFDKVPTHKFNGKLCPISFSLSCCFSFLNAFDLALALASSSSWTNALPTVCTPSQIQTFFFLSTPLLSFFLFHFVFLLIRRCAMSSWLLRLLVWFLHHFKHINRQTHTLTHSHIYISIYFPIRITTGKFCIFTIFNI